MKQIIYQAMARLWGKGRFSSWDLKTLDYLGSLGVDYLWLTGIPRHASGKDFVKGDPGSPYAVSDWTDVNPYLADRPEERMKEFSLLVRRVHRKGMKLVIDYVPNHVARDYRGGIVHHDWCDGDWTDTLKNDWSSPQTFGEMLRILRFWKALGVDGFRCDMVELVPCDSLKGLIAAVKEDYPDTMFIAEVYDRGNYRKYVEEVGFDLLYDKSGFYDRLVSLSRGECSARELSWNWQFLSDLQPRMLNFLENHDEIRIASRQGLGSAGRSYAALGVSLLFNDASFMLYFGQEAGEDASESSDGRTSIFNWCCPRSVEHLNCAIHIGKGLSDGESAVLDRYRELLGLAKLPVFASGKCWDLCYCNLSSPGFDADRHFVFLRYDGSQTYLVACNFSDNPASFQVAIPRELSPVCPEPSVQMTIGAWDTAVARLR